MKKVPTPRTFELLAFDGKFTFEKIHFISAHKASLNLYVEINQKNSKVNFSSKAKSFNVRDFLITKNTVVHDR